jgi:hypoxanthine phosphoribosyltransferase
LLFLIAIYKEQLMKHYITWQEYSDLIQKLAKKIYMEKSNNFDQIICLARGGVPLGDALSRLFNLPLAILFTSSYRLMQHQEGLFIDNQIAKQNNELGKRILLVDDLVDSGITFQGVVEYLKNKESITLLKTATLWTKDTSVFKPDYTVHNTTKDDWIVQPFEIYDDLKIENL